MSNMASPTSPTGTTGAGPGTETSNQNSSSNNNHSNENGNGNGTGNELFPLDFLSFTNFNTDGSGTSPQTQMQIHEKNAGTPSSTVGMGMDFDFSQFAALAQDDTPSQSQNPGQDQAHGHGHSIAGGSSRGGSTNGSLRKRGSMSSVSGNGNGSERPTGSGAGAGAGEAGLGMDLDLKGGLSNADFQMMLDAASASAGASAAAGNSTNNGNGNNGESFDQASLQQQLEHIHMQSPLVFGQLAGMAQQHHHQHQHQHQQQQQSMSLSQSQGQGQSPYNALAQYLTSPLAQTQTIGDQSNGNSLGNGTSGSQDGDDRKKWMLATGLGGLFTPGPSGEMIPQVRPEHMSPMQLEMLAREGFDIDFSNNMPLLSPALSQQQSNSSYASPMHTAGFPSTSPFQQAQAYNSLGTNNQQLPPSPLEALQIQQRHFQEQLALLQHQQRQMQATAEAVVAAGAGASTSNSPYVAAAGTSNSGSSSRMATTPGTGNGHGGPHSANASPSYFSPLTSPALEATRGNGNGNGNGNHHGFSRHHHHNHNHNQSVSQHYSPGFDPRSNKRTPHPLSALSSPALNPIGSSGGAQQTLSPALGPQNNADMTDPEYFRALVGMLDNQGQQVQHQQPQHLHQSNGIRSNQSRRSLTQDSLNGNGSMSAHPSPINIQSIDTASLSSPLVGPSSATSTSGPGPNRHSLPVRTRPSPMIKPTPAQRGHHSRNGSTQHSPIVNTSLQQQQRYSNYSPMATVPHPNYLPPAAIDQRGVQQHQHQQHQMTLSTTSETPSPVDLSTIMPPPPIPGTSGVKGVIPMTPATLMNLGAGRPTVAGAGAGGDAAVPNGTSSKSGKSDDTTSSLSQPQTQGQLPKRQAARNSTQSQSQSQATKPARKTGAGAGASGSTTPTLAPSNSGAAGGGSNGKKVKIAPAGKRTLAARPPGVGVRAATKGAAAAAAQQATLPEGETRKTSHKAAEQKRRDSLKAGFDELRLLLPPINTEALDPESGEPIPGSSAPRLLPKSSLVPDDNPNRGVSKVALLKFGNEYIERLHEKVDKRDDYIERLRSEVERLRLSVAGGAGAGAGEMITGPEGEDLLEMNMLDGEEEYDGDDDDEEDVDGEGGSGEDIDEDQIEADDDDLEGGGDELDFDLDREASNGMELDQDEYTEPASTPAPKSITTNTKRRSIGKGVGTGKSPALGAATTNTTTKRPQVSRGLSNGHANGHGGRGRKVEA